MAGKKGMKWFKNKRKHSVTVDDALEKNQERLDELMDDLYSLATDDKASRKERMEALKFLIEKAVPKSSYESSGRGIIIPVGDDYARAGLEAIRQDLEDRTMRIGQSPYLPKRTGT